MINDKFPPELPPLAART